MKKRNRDAEEKKGKVRGRRTTSMMNPVSLIQKRKAGQQKMKGYGCEALTASVLMNTDSSNGTHQTDEEDLGVY